MKVLAVDHNALDPTNLSFYNELSRQPDIQLRLVIPDHWYDNYAMLRSDGIQGTSRYKIIPSRMLFANRTHRLIYLSLDEQLRYFEPDILFMNSEPENFQTVQGALLLTLQHYPAKLVFTSWRNIDHSVVGYPYKFQFLNTLAEKIVLDSAAHGIMFNEDAKQIFNRNGFPGTTVIPPCVDTSIFKKNASPKSIPGTGNSYTIGYVGRLTPEKGIDTLLEAVSGLSFDYRVIIIGEGSVKSVLQQQAAKLQISDHIVWLPPQPRVEIPSYLSVMDTVVLPSKTGKYWKEQFGRILIEAMACDTAVIGSDSGEIPNVIAEAGLIFPEGNAGVLKDHITALHDDVDMKFSLISKGKWRVNEYYSQKNVAARYGELFTQLMKTKK
ncbi:MAG: glycosyltransferase [Bacteroidota bacterium]